MSGNNKSYTIRFDVAARTLPFLLLFLIILTLYSCDKSASLSPRCRTSFDSLMEMMPQRKAIMARHRTVTDSIANAIGVNKDLPPAVRFYAYKKLFFQSHLFSVDYSIRFSGRMAEIAKNMGDNARFAEAMTYYGYSLVRCGLFKEGIDTLSTIHVDDSMPDSVLYAYYTYSGRAYHDLASYGARPFNGGISADNAFNRTIIRRYVDTGNALLAKALPHAGNAIERNYILGKRLFFSNRQREALKYYEAAAKLCSPKDSEWRSILLSTIAALRNSIGDREAGTYYDILSVRNDITNAIIETNAPSNLAGDLFYGYDETKISFTFLNMAIDNAACYGSRYRVTMLGEILPMLIQQRQIEQSKRYSFMTCTIVALFAFTILLVFLLKKNKKTSKLLKSNHEELSEAYRQLSLSNSSLDTLNKQLSEATRLKNQYLGHYMDKEQETINQINDFTVLLSNKLSLGQEQHVQRLLREFRSAHDQKAERDDFDHTFTSAFPTFVKEFNGLLSPDARQEPEAPDKLTPVLRIYALVRLGITDTKRIARALNYTFNTVYNYRVRIRNKALNPQTFEEDVTRIGL